MDSAPLTSEDIALRYLEQLPWPAYPFQEQAILSWFEPCDGILVCAPTGTGKTVIAETALYEALMTGRRAFYTTPLIALTEQKFRELQEAAVRWGFSAASIGLVTGNRRENPDAPILVVVAEILLNKLLSPEEDSLDDVSAVVMDEFHSFNDPERGIVWELSLGLLPKHCRLLLISATVGNATDFVVWLARMHGRRLRLLQSDERRVPLDFRWIPDELLQDQLQLMTDGDDTQRYTPALVFCFNRNECWSVAEQLKGKNLLADGQQKQLLAELDQHDWSVGAGGKLRQFLLRGVGLHHAGLLPKYRRIVERLFQKKLLSLCVCTETLAAGINLPARSVVMTSLLKGPPGGMKLIDASSAHQMFGRAGRPQYDSRGYVFAVAHEDDVRLFRWQQKYDEIPEDTKDPMLLRAKKNLKKKMPKKRDGVQYWTEKQFQSLREAPAAKLASRGRFPWRLLAFLIRKSGTVQSLQDSIQKRLLEPAEKDEALKHLTRMLRTLESGGFITLDPPPPRPPQMPGMDSIDNQAPFHSTLAVRAAIELLRAIDSKTGNTQSRWLSGLLPAISEEPPELTGSEVSEPDVPVEFGEGVSEDDSPDTDDAAAPTAMEVLTGVPDDPQRIAAGEITSEGRLADAASEDEKKAAAAEATTSTVSGNENNSETAPPASAGLLGRMIQEARSSGTSKSAGPAKAPKRDRRESVAAGDFPEYHPRLAIAAPALKLINCFRSINPLYGVFLAEHLHKASYEERLQLLESVLDLPSSVAVMVRVPLPEVMPPGPLAMEFLNPRLVSRGLITQQDLTGYFDETTRRRVFPIPLGDRMRMLFQCEYPGVSDVFQRSVWCIGDLLRFGGNFDRYVRTRELTKQEGIIFRHCLRMILLCGEFAELEPPQLDPMEWRRDLADLASLLTETCRAVDPSSTDEVLTALRNHAEGLDPAF
ncbi:MAG: DEAD/DEAH box helicase [Planctomycetia bacterium]